MSSEDQKQNRQETVDIDQLEVSIFIIAKNPDQLKSATQFLTRRGWPTKCLGNISEAIGTIINESPDVVLISVDHPNPNVSRLPILLAQTLNTICIGFAEDGGAISLNNLNKSRFKHKFNGFPSGPSIHRFIRQTLDSIYNPEQLKTPKNKVSGIESFEHDSNSIQVKGNRNQPAVKISGENQPGASHTSGKERKRLKDIANLKTDSELSAAEMLQKLSQGEDFDTIKEQNNRLSESNQSESKQGRTNKTDKTNSNEDSNKSNTGYYQKVLENTGSDESEKEKIAKKERVKAKKKAFPWQKNTKEQETPIKNQQNRPGATFNLKQTRDQFQPDSDEPIIETNKKSASGFDIQKGAKSKNGMYIPDPTDKNKRNLDLTQDPNEKNKNLPEFGQGEGKKDKNYPEQNLDTNLNKKLGSENSDAGEIEAKSGSENFIGQNKKSKRLEEKEFIAKNKKLTEQENKFKESVQNALKETCEEPDPNALIEIEETEQLGIIPVDSQKIHGYFIVGRGGIGFSLGTVFLDILSDAVEKHLALKGIDIHCQKPFLLDTESFDFDRWANTVENFTLFEQSGREEIAVTFVPTKDRIPHIVDSDKSPDMAKINVKHLSVEKAVDFDSYIHLEKNSRFYKYLNNGSKILPRQLETLINSKKATSLHINKSEFEKFKKYVAEILIEDLIQTVNNPSSEDGDGGEGAA